MLTHKGTQTIYAERLVLRRFTVDDAQAMYDNWANDERVSRFLSWSPHKSSEETKQLLEGWCDAYKNDTTYNWAIEFDRTVIGSISVVEIKERHERAEIGYCMGYISYIRTAQGFLYLSVIRDLYDNSIVSYKTSTNQNINLVLNTIRSAKKKEKVTAELQLHSDQGFQYTSHAYFNLTKSYGITPSMSRRGNPYDNALAENFFSILKTECINRIKLKTFAEAIKVIDEYIYFYNYERIQLKTKLTPMEYRNQFVA